MLLLHPGGPLNTVPAREWIAALIAAANDAASKDDYETALRTFRELLRDAYLTFDRRTLGFSRILLGFLMIMDLFRRTPDWMSMFGDHGVLPAPLI